MEQHIVREDLFPYESVREEQSEFLADVAEAVRSRQILLAHAPTGLGKTAATLAPALKYAIDNDLSVFFLTSRHTQHKVAIETLDKISKKYDLTLKVTDLIGKKWMCLVPGAELMYSGEFSDYCRKMREANSCKFYNNTQKGNGTLNHDAQLASDEISQAGVFSVDEMIKFSAERELCPYYFTMARAKESQVIITDYNYLFNRRIRDGFFLKLNKKLEKSIIIVDEAHNLPSRLRNLMTSKLSTLMLKGAIKEAKKHGYEETAQLVEQIQDALIELANNTKEEKIVTRADFIRKIIPIKTYGELVEDFTFVGDAIREKQKHSFVGSIGRFLDDWLTEGKGFLRSIEITQGKGGSVTTLHNRCLDPSMISTEVFDEAHSSILMSGTLTPVTMYRDVLGCDPARSVCKRYRNPFPQDNRLNLIVPKTSTKYSARSEEQYKNIATLCAQAVNAVPGNSAIFFPSYQLRENVHKYFDPQCRKTTLKEMPGLTTEEKHELIETFKSYHGVGAVLLGVASGSFGEGIDLPGDFLKCVIVVGLPLKQPTLQTKELIKYYDTEFRRGWDYGYTYPALNKVLQAAGRCIRSDTDRGAILFIDERYTWENYYKCFPLDWQVRVTTDFQDLLTTFFSSGQE